MPENVISACVLTTYTRHNLMYLLVVVQVRVILDVYSTVLHGLHVRRSAIANSPRIRIRIRYRYAVSWWNDFWLSTMLTSEPGTGTYCRLLKVRITQYRYRCAHIGYSVNESNTVIGRRSTPPIHPCTWERFHYGRERGAYPHICCPMGLGFPYGRINRIILVCQYCRVKKIQRWGTRGETKLDQNSHSLTHSLTLAHHVFGTQITNHCTIRWIMKPWIIPKSP